MKANQRTIKVYDKTHTIAAQLSQRFGISMCALVDVLVYNAKDMKALDLPARPSRGRKMNARRALSS